jgi:ElaB/YqjD/DUF883 family membrane-anchored ribosome-binding protein
MTSGQAPLAVAEGLSQLLQQGWWGQFRAGAADAAGRAWAQARAGTGALTQEVTHRAGEGVAALAGRIAARPLASVAVAFLLGLTVGALLRRRR